MIIFIIIHLFIFATINVLNYFTPLIKFSSLNVFNYKIKVIALN
jgi:hypothetical protein